MHRRYFAILLAILFSLQGVYGDVIKSTVSIHAGVTGVKPGATIPVALLIELPDGWYTYAEDPGDAGMPPDIRFRAPEGVTIGAWRFPPHQTFTDAAGTSYGYKQRVVLLNEITLPSEIPSGVAFQSIFDVIWMICKDLCLPFRDRVTLLLPQLEESADLVPSTGWKVLLHSGGWEEEKRAVIAE
ncbi:MAG: protein-disulfide reductase DsbD domain-containing protein [Kiritimatiellia bacterium]